MAIEKQIKTKISLRYLEYATWSAESFKTEKPLKGEVWFCAIPEGNAAATTAPTMLFKVGDGVNTFGSLKWGSALAADVYGWAKKEHLDLADLPDIPVVEEGSGKFVTGITWDETNNKIVVTRANVALDDISDKEKIALAEDLGVVTNLTTTAQTAVGAINEHDIEIGDLAQLNTTNKNNLVVAINEALQAVETGGTGSVVTLVKEDKTTYDEYTLKQGGKAVGDKVIVGKNSLTMKAGSGLSATETSFSSNGTDAPVFEVSHADTSNVANVTAADRTYVKSLTFDDYGHVTAVDVGTETVVDTNTAHTHAAGDGLKLGDVKGGIDGEVKYELNLAFEELTTDNKLRLVDATSKELVAEFDAAAFVKDSFLEGASYDEDTNDLTLTFIDNSDNKQDIVIPLDDLVDVYTADETSITLTTSGDGKVFKVKEGGIEAKHLAANAVTTEKILDKNVTEEKLEQDVQDALALARSSIQGVEFIQGNDGATLNVYNGDQSLDEYMPILGDTYIETEVRDDELHIEASEALKTAVTNANSAVQSAKFAGTALTKTGTELSISQADARTALGLGTAAYKAEEDFATADEYHSLNISVGASSTNEPGKKNTHYVQLTGYDRHAPQWGAGATLGEAYFEGADGIELSIGTGSTIAGQAIKIAVEEEIIAGAAKGATAVQDVSTPTGSGLKVTTVDAPGVGKSIDVEIDDDVVFVLNCNY